MLVINWTGPPSHNLLFSFLFYVLEVSPEDDRRNKAVLLRRNNSGSGAQESLSLVLSNAESEGFHSV